MVEVYVLQTDGNLLYYTSLFEDTRVSIETATLFSGIISAIHAFLKELERGEIRTFTTNENMIIIRNEEEFSFALVLNKDMEVEENIIYDFLSELTRQVLPILSENTSTSRLDDKASEEVEKITKKLLEEFRIKFRESQAARNLMEDLW